MSKYIFFLLCFTLLASCQKQKQERDVKRNLQGTWIWTDSDIDFETWNGYYHQHYNNSSNNQWQIEIEGRKINITHTGSPEAYSYSGTYEIDQVGSKSQPEYTLFIKPENDEQVNKYFHITDISDDTKLSILNFPFNKPTGFSSFTITNSNNNFEKL